MNQILSPRPPESKEEKPFTTNNPAHEENEEKGKVLKRMHYIFQILRSKKISMSSLQAVLYLYINRREAICLGTLASSLGITSAAVTSVADGVEKLGFAKRMVNPMDRRLTLIGLTHRGLTFAEWLESTMLVTNPRPVDFPTRERSLPKGG